MFFYLSELLFSGFLQLKDNSKNNSKHRDKVPLSLKFGVFVSVVREVPTPLGISEKCLIFFFVMLEEWSQKIAGNFNRVLEDSYKIEICYGGLFTFSNFTFFSSKCFTKQFL